MHGLGNDFVIIDRRAQSLSFTPDHVRRLADRHTGIGFDQLILLEEGIPGTDVTMKIFNADASEAETCGNAACCVAHLIMQEKQYHKVIIATKANHLAAWRYDTHRIVVDMGLPQFEWDAIPLAEHVDMDHLPLRFDRLSNPTVVAVGNPHVIFFTSHDLEEIPVHEIGPLVEHHPLFPKRINVSFAQIRRPDHIRLRVWERGAGLTRACGSGACATVVAATQRGFSHRHATVFLDHGTLDIEWDKNDHVLMTGSSATSFTGIIDAHLLDD